MTRKPHKQDDSPESRKHYDVLVIGAGIHGAGVAQAASAAGYSVLVLEQKTVASGTSSRSSKLIHGGLRYLEHGQFALVRECLRERSLLLKLAPSLVYLQPFYIPVYGDSSRGKWLIRAGLTLYSLLGGTGSETRFRRVPRCEWHSLDGLTTHNLTAVFQYWDAQTDDALLTRAVMTSAQNLGVELQEKAEFCGAEIVAGPPQKMHWDIHFRHTENESTHNLLAYEQACTATVIVNAAGPWVNKVMERVEEPMPRLDVKLIQGTHLVLEGEVTRGIYYLESPRDKRPVFVMPWKMTTNGRDKNAILLGTTETHFQNDPATVQPLEEEIAYLLETYRHFFPVEAVTNNTSPERRQAQVLDAFAGLRVLPGDAFAGEKTATRQTAHSPPHAARPRETVLHPDRVQQPRFITIYGGKLTSYRATAEKVMKMLQESLPERVSVADTRSLPLHRP
ncbi:MAG: FAD-dependent oxidoreductase [Ectothiorhodospiraceae bacterium]|nr:FAD-dependent oxidoreductase [Ectothiorhodospiraceae bacterium]